MERDEEKSETMPTETETKIPVEDLEVVRQWAGWVFLFLRQPQGGMRRF